MHENYVTKNKDGRYVSSHPYFRALMMMLEEESEDIITYLLKDKYACATIKKWNRTAESVNEFNAIFIHTLFMYYFGHYHTEEETVAQLDTLARAHSMDEVRNALMLSDAEGYKRMVLLALMDIKVYYASFYCDLANMIEFIMDSVRYAKESLQ